MEKSKRYEIRFIEIGFDDDHVYFPMQSAPMCSPKKIVQTIKSITAFEIFKKVPSVKKPLSGGEFWTKGYFINTVGQFVSNKETISEYVKKQGRKKEYKKLHNQQLMLFD